MATQTITHSQALLAADRDMIGRVSSVMITERLAQGPDPMAEAWALTPYVAAEPGIAAAYHSALLSGRTDAATADDVITDEMLLAAVVAAASRPAS
jgi:hypothetical protein